MTLPAPILDDRTYEQLRDELLRRIPVYTPEWSDHGPSDPGVTLLELLAFLGENLLFRFNQIPDQTEMWLLRLLQIPPRPGRPATGLVAFAPRPSTLPTTPAVRLGTSVLAAAVPFRVGNDVRVLPVEATAVAKAAADAPTDPVLDEEYRRVLDAADLDEKDAQPYSTIALVADPGAPEHRPLDVSAAIDHCLWIAIRALPGVPDAAATALLAPDGPLASDPLSIGVSVGAEFPTVDEIDPCEGILAGFEHRRVQASVDRARVAACAPTVEVAGPEPAPGASATSGDPTLHWQVSAGVDASGSPRYLPLVLEGDTTAGLTRDGVLQLRLPLVDLDEIGAPEPDDEDLAGVGDRPPDLVTDRRVLFWIRAFPRQRTSEIGRLRWVGANAATVEQVVDTSPELLGSGNGLAHQEVAVAHPSVRPGTLTIEVEEHGEWVPWTVVDTFAGSGPGDRHITVDHAAGVVRCGDSVRGRTFGIGHRIRCRPYRYGGGLAGNVPPGGIATVEGVPTASAANPVATSGGEDAETISQARARIPGELTRHDRAVTADDFRELAAITGVGRSACLPRFDPKTKADDAAGVVTVIVWPTDDPLHPSAPVPNAGLLRAVCRRLDERRLVTTELYVVPPTYRKVGVSLGIAVEPGASAIGVRRWVELVLHQFLAPLPPYGPAGDGWPLGHRVHGPELEAAVLQVDGVDFIEDLKVADLSGGEPVPGTVELNGWEVPELTELTVVVGTGVPDPGAGGVTPPPSKDPVPVPTPREEC
jgi:hypothetical protein